MIGRTRNQWIDVCQNITAGPVAKGGDKNGLYDNACSLRDMLFEMNLWRNGDSILEIGSGNGRFAMGLSEKDNVNYTGVEIIKGCVDFCNDAFSPYENISFHHIDAYNPRYWSVGALKPENITLPVENESFDLVIMLSVMTHITAPVVNRYVAEAGRVLKPSGLFFTTWFRSPPNRVTDDAARTVYTESDIYEFLRPFTFIDETGGNTTDPNDQWYVTCKKVR